MTELSQENEIKGGSTLQDSEYNFQAALERYSEQHDGINSLLEKMRENPDESNKILEESMAKISPEMIENAKKFAMSDQAVQLMKDMQKKGLDPRMIQSQLANIKRSNRISKNKGESKKAILITSSRRIKVKDVQVDSVDKDAKIILKSPGIKETLCSKLKVGSFTDKTIKIWYNPNFPGKNKRASKLTELPVGGDVLIVMEEGDLLEKDFEEAEQLINV